MSSADLWPLIVGVVQGVLSSTVFVLALFIGFCVAFGLTKLKKTAGGTMVVKSLDEQVARQPVSYLAPNAPRGPADQLKTPELLEAAARK
jgi:hypothetical protein